MNTQTRFSIHSRLKSFQFAFAGIFKFFATEHNARLHLIAGIAVLILSIVVRVSSSEALALTIAIALVWMAEMFNTCIEKIMDMITQDYQSSVKVIKDISAGAVLVAAIAAFVIGVVVFIPKFI